MARWTQSLRGRLVGGFLLVSLVPVVVSLWVGSRLLYDAFLNEGHNRVRQDLNAAREILDQRVQQVTLGLTTVADGDAPLGALRSGDVEALRSVLRHLSRRAGLDFAGLVASDGRTLVRLGPGSPSGRPVSNPLAALALQRGAAVVGVAVWTSDVLGAEDPALAARARIPRRGGAGAGAGAGDPDAGAGLVIAAAVPVVDGAAVRGVLYGGILLHRYDALVDRIRDTLFREETVGGSDLGTATIFFRNRRVATNVLEPGGRRALGTRVSAAVEREVLQRGSRWVGRAYVVNAWYLTAYEPLVDVLGHRVGMLYVGVREEKYAAVRNRALYWLAGLSLAGGLLAFGLGALVERWLLRPVHRLVAASREVAKGNLSPELGRRRGGEMGVLQSTFREMLEALRRRDVEARAESDHRLLQTEKQASVGRLAAGVAHEINNPLTGVLAYTHLLLRRQDLAADIRADLETIVGATERVRQVVKGLLDFSRQTALDREPVDVNRLVRSTVALVENQALVKGVQLQIKLAEQTPTLTLDRNQMQGVLLNLLLNALDATRPGDRITVTTGGSVSTEQASRDGVVIAVRDTGCGIPQEHLKRLFEPFFTTKEVGQGTGLGLAVSYGIVHRHGGTIQVFSEEGKGSTFTIWLPMSEVDDESPGG